jgi:hypothetical protein
VAKYITVGACGRVYVTEESIHLMIVRMQRERERVRERKKIQGLGHNIPFRDTSPMT